MFRTVQGDHGGPILNGCLDFLQRFQMVAVGGVAAVVVRLKYLPGHVVQHLAVAAARQGQLPLGLLGQHREHAGAGESRDVGAGHQPQPVTQTHGHIMTVQTHRLQLRKPLLQGRQVLVGQGAFLPAFLAIISHSTSKCAVETIPNGQKALMRCTKDSIPNVVPGTKRVLDWFKTTACQVFDHIFVIHVFSK